jgi:hypothetical protein
MYNSSIKKQNIPYVRMGEANEQAVEDIIKDRYGDFKKLSSAKDETHFEIIDYDISIGKLEVKSRSVSYNSYKDFMIGLNKIEDGLETIHKGKRWILIYIFTDATYEYELTKENYNKNYAMNYKEKFGKEYEKKGYTTFNPSKKNYYIPKTLWTKISDLKSKPISLFE